MGNESNTRPQSAARRAAARHLAMVKARNKRIILLTLSLCLCLVLVAGIATGLFFLLRNPKDDGKILENVVVGGVAIGGMTKEDAENAIRLSIEPVITKQTMLVRLENETLELTPELTGVVLDVDDLIEAAYNYGRTGTRLEQNLARAQAKKQTYTIALLPYLRLDLTRIRSVVETFCAEYNVEMVPPSVVVTGERPDYTGSTSAAHQILTITMGYPESYLDPRDLYYEILDAYSLMTMELVYNMPVLVEPEVPDAQEIFDTYCLKPIDATIDSKTFEITKETYGYGFNVYALQRMIDRAGYGEVIEITMEFLRPDITAQDLNANLFQDRLSSCTANSTENDSARNNNLATACETLDGVVIKAGEKLDLNAVLGPRTTERHYVSAPTYIGSPTSIIGGGVDQVASALYECALRAGLRIDVHVNHRYAMSYTTMGISAAMGSGENLVITNTTSAPIRVLAQATGSSVKITIMGTETRKYMVDIESSVVTQTDPVTVYQPMQEDNVYGYQDGDIIQTGLTGYEVITYICTYDRRTGALVSREMLETIVYESRDIIVIKIGGLEPPPTEPSDPTEPTDPTDPSDPIDQIKPTDPIVSTQ